MRAGLGGVAFGTSFELTTRPDADAGSTLSSSSLDHHYQEMWYFVEARLI